MAIRLVITLNAAPGKGDEFLQALKGRCGEVMTEPGCEQFEVFQSALDPDRLTLLELWSGRPGRARRPRQDERHPRAVPERPARRGGRPRGLRVQQDPVAPARQTAATGSRGTSRKPSAG